MAFHPKKFLAQTGLHYDAKTQSFWGDYAGYSVFVRYIAQRGFLIFRLCGKLPESNSTDFNAWLQQWQLEHSGISNAEFSGTQLQAMLSLSSRDTDANAVSNFSLLVETARQYGLIPCCGGCGVEYGYEPYQVNDIGIALCSSCAMHVEEQLQQNQTEKSSEKGKLWGVLLGTAIGAVVLFLLTYILWQLGFLAYITGYVGILVSMLCIRKFSGKLTKGAAAFCVVVCLAVAVATPCICIANEFAKNFSENALDAKEYMATFEELRTDLDTCDDELLYEYYGESRSELESLWKDGSETLTLVLEHTTMQECLTDLPTLLKDEDYSEVKGELIKDILWGVLSIIIGAAVTLPAAVGESSGKYTFRRLSA